MIQKAVTGRTRRMLMHPGEPEWPAELVYPGLYLHVPFCKNLCSYCPYNRVEYHEDLFAAYEQAIKQEITLYAPHLRGYRFSSLYIGGGTPTVNLPGLLRILSHLRHEIPIDCDICIELHPANMGDDCLAALRDAGVTMLSVGVESTSDRILERIGRSHDGRMAIEAVERGVGAGFKSVNADLMFALPGQTSEDWRRDVASVIGAGVDQLSTYPLFSFPYSDLGQQAGIRKVTRPKHAVVREMLAFTDEFCGSRGLKRCAVWSWLRPSRSKFSSITRHHYVGFGPSAASMTGREFYVNTFDVGAYAESLPNRRPVAISMPLSRRLEMAYWLYWRVYELKFSQADFEGVFGSGNDLHGEFGGLFAPVRAIGMLKRSGHSYEITPSGAYWIHRLQNEYSLNYINRLWGTCRQTPWPQEVRL